MPSAYDTCPVCKKERSLYKKKNVWLFVKHRRWDGEKMVFCTGSDNPPARKNPANVIFKPPGQ